MFKKLVILNFHPPLLHTIHTGCLSAFSRLQWEPVPYFNNKIICDLVEEKYRGIISILVN